ncbi:ECF-type sigma factor [Alicyclobacillus pomorum]|uniref:ECF-type sigma factor n=1 Tax=Alicyclobacillus pomorum TaxID=204470 RepID=UPI00047E3729
MDLEKRLQSDMLTPSDRQTVAFRFFAGLTNREVAHVLGKSEKAIEKRIDQWRDRWTDALVGDGTPVNQRVSPGLHISFHPDIDKWNEDILHNRNQWWIVPTAVSRAILDTFGCKPKSNRKEYISKRPPYYITKLWTVKMCRAVPIGRY